MRLGLPICHGDGSFPSSLRRANGRLAIHIHPASVGSLGRLPNHIDSSNVPRLSSVPDDPPPTWHYVKSWPIHSLLFTPFGNFSVPLLGTPTPHNAGKSYSCAKAFTCICTVRWPTSVTWRHTAIKP